MNAHLLLFSSTCEKGGGLEVVEDGGGIGGGNGDNGRFVKYIHLLYFPCHQSI